MRKAYLRRIIERRYILRPTLPYIITSFAMLLITFWQGIIVLEVFFDWPGLGKLFMNSIVANEVSVTIGIVVVFALLLGISVLLLDIIYALVDPRVKLEGSGQTEHSVSLHRRGFPFGSSLKLIDRLRSIGQDVALSVKSRVDQTARYIQIQRLPGRQPQQVLVSSRFSQTDLAEQTDLARYCPYLRLDNNRGQVLQAASQRCRCYVNGRPERIGALFQTKVCRTPSYQQCSRLGSSLNPQKKKDNQGGFIQPVEGFTKN